MLENLEIQGDATFDNSILESTILYHLRISFHRYVFFHDPKLGIEDLPLEILETVIPEDSLEALSLTSRGMRIRAQEIGYLRPFLEISSVVPWERLVRSRKRRVRGPGSSTGRSTAETLTANPR